MTTFNKYSGFAFIAMLAFLFWPPASARADLTITPVRVVFQARDRSASVELLNITNTINTYRLSWMQMHLENGRYILGPVDDNDPNSVAKMVIFTPRQVTIEPHGHQTIRLSLRRPADLPAGEYRAHLVMTRLARMGPDPRNPNDGKTASMSLKVNLGFSIPVIVRSGDDKDLKVVLSAPKLAMSRSKPPTPELDVDIVRQAGKFSSYGYLEVFWTPTGSVEKEIGGLGNIALYPELQQRHLEIPLTASPTNGTLRVVYMGKYESEGTTWDQKTFPIGQ